MQTPSIKPTDRSGHRRPDSDPRTSAAEPDGVKPIAVVSRYLLIGCALIACLVHLAIRVYGLNCSDLDIDEVITWHFSKYLFSCARDVLLDVHPPTHVLLLSIWQKLFGDSEISLRFPSVLFSLMTLIALMMYSGMLRDDERPRFLAFLCILYCFFPYDIYLARYARSYAMMMFFSAAFSYCHYKLIIYEDRRYLPLSVCLGAASVYTHFQAIFVLVSTFASALLAGYSRPRAAMSLKAALWTAALCIPLLPIFPLQSLFANFLSSVRATRSHVSAGDFCVLFSPRSQGFALPWSDPVLLDYVGMGFVVLAVGTVVIQVWRHRDSEIFKTLFMQFGLIVGLIAVSPLNRIHEKSICILFPSGVLLLAFAMAKLRDRLARTTAAAYVVGFVALSASCFPYTSICTDWKATWSYLAPIIANSKSTVLLVSPSLELLPVQYYLCRRDIGDLPPIWTWGAQGAVLLSPCADRLNLNVVSRPAFRLANGKTIRSSGSFWWVACKAFAENKDVSDIYFLRVGSGDLLKGIEARPDLPVTSLARFGLVAILHIKRSEEWCTLFDPEHYIKQRPELANTSAIPMREYLLEAPSPGSVTNPSPLFDTKYYRRVSPDPIDPGMTPLGHFIEKGARQGRNPHPLFDIGYYLKENPDVARSGENPLVHFIKRGANEGRNPNPDFDIARYLKEHPEVAASGENPLVHFFEKSGQQR